MPAETRTGRSNETEVTRRVARRKIQNRIRVDSPWCPNPSTLVRENKTQHTLIRRPWCPNPHLRRPWCGILQRNTLAPGHPILNFPPSLAPAPTLRDHPKSESKRAFRGVAHPGHDHLRAAKIRIRMRVLRPRPTGEKGPGRATPAVPRSEPEPRSTDADAATRASHALCRHMSAFTNPQRV